MIASRFRRALPCLVGFTALSLFSSTACSRANDDAMGDGDPAGSLGGNGNTGETGGASSGVPASGGVSAATGGVVSGAGGTTGATCTTDDATAPFAATEFYVPSGWMGDIRDIAATEGGCPDRPLESSRFSHPVGDCSAFTYTPSGTGSGWAGVNYLYPSNNWGAAPGLCIAEGATTVTFWAKGAAGGEVVGFEAAGVKLEGVTLTDVWAEYSIVLGSTDYRAQAAGGGVWAGFGWNMAADAGSSTIYLDNIEWTNTSGGMGGAGN